jgi:hypothetical protein
MSVAALVQAMAAGASVLALWVFVRLGDRRPRSLRHVIVHLVIAVLLISAAPVVMERVVRAGESPETAAAGLFGVFLPAMTYVFLAALYLLEQLQRALYAR